MLRVCTVVAALILAGCCKPELVRVPVEVEVERRVVEPIPPELLQPHPVATGQLSECPDVARARRAELEQCNADKAALRAREEH